MDFVTDSVGNRRAIRILTAVDPITKEAVIVKPCFSMTGREVSEELEKAAGRNGPLLYLQTDNGPEQGTGRMVHTEQCKTYLFQARETGRQLFCGSVQQDSENGMP